MAFFPPNNQPTYDPVAVQPMRDELLATGFKELFSPEDVDQALLNNPDKTVLVVVNSVCGCAAGSARPGVNLALQHKVIPDELYTVFAGQEKLAVAHLRKTYLSQFTPSSPCMALFKNGEVLFMLHRYEIEGRTHEQVASALTAGFDQFCSRPGPSIATAQYEQLMHTKFCGSQVPRFNG